MDYQHLTQSQRYQIARLREKGFSCREIAGVIFCHHSTVARELKRNRGQHTYRGGQAHVMAVRRRHQASSRVRISPKTWTLVEQHLRLDWSPEQIVGRGVVAISIERIYQHVAHDKRCGGDLWRHRRRRKRRHRRIGSPRQRFSGRRISERPARVDQRKQIGDWEADSVIGQGPVRVISLVERKSRYTRLVRVADGTAAQARDGILASLYRLRHWVKTITYDNGSEFAEHARIDLGLESTGFFADPHSPWQRATNENTNGLLRQYLPKGKSMAKVTDQQLQDIENKLNDRPRKVLGFKTPTEVLFQSIKRRAS